MPELLLQASQTVERTRVLVIGALDHRTADQFREQNSRLIANEDTRRRLPYPKDNEARTMELPPDLVDQLVDWIAPGLGPATCCSRPARAPRSRGTRSAPAIWRPAIKASGVDFDVRVHDLRHAHASWLLAGGSDLKSVMDRMGHAQITTTQKYLHTLPDADAKNLDALNRVRRKDPNDPIGPEGADRTSHPE